MQWPMSLSEYTTRVFSSFSTCWRRSVFIRSIPSKHNVTCFF